jgi:glutamate racemase
MYKYHPLVAFFDSGIGGLTVLDECVRRLPSVRFLYYGDNKHAPYGNLSAEQIRRYVFSSVEEIASFPLDALVLACNTATALCVDALRKRYPFPIVGIEPAIAPAMRAGGEVWVFATPATCASQRFNANLEKLLRAHPHARTFIKPCPRWAGEIEKNVVERCVVPTLDLPTGTPSSVVLGCTHYGYAKRQIKSFYNCPVYEGSEGIARRLGKILRVEDSMEKPPKIPDVTFVGDCAKLNEKVFEQMFVVLEW